MGGRMGVEMGGRIWGEELLYSKSCTYDVYIY